VLVLVLGRFASLMPVAGSAFAGIRPPPSRAARCGLLVAVRSDTATHMHPRAPAVLASDRGAALPL